MRWIKIFGSLTEAEQVLNRRNPVRLKVGDRNLCLTLFNGEYYVTDNACPHQRESLNGGIVNYLGEIICPLHFYRFSLKTGRECQGRTEDLQTYRLRYDQNGFYIYI